MNLFMYLVSKNITPAFCEFFVNKHLVSQGVASFVKKWPLSLFTKLLLLLLLTSFQIQCIKVVVLCLSASTAVHPDQDHAGVGRRHRLQVENTERCRPQPGKKFSDARFCWKCFGIKRVSVAPSLLALVYLIALHLCTGNLFIIKKYEPASTSFCVFLLLDIYKPKTVNLTNRMNISALWCSGFVQQ